MGSPHTGYIQYSTIEFLPIVCIRLSGILIRLLVCTIMQWFFKHFGTGEFFPNYEILKIVGQNLCTPDMKIIDGICEDVLFLICGFDRGDTNIVSLIMPCVITVRCGLL